jgi:predicted dinucleotide-binding enzyme
VIEAEISTRVPEKLTAELASEVQAYYDNKRLLARSDVVFICVPKNKVKNVFNDIRSEYSDQMKNKQVD